MEQEKNVQAYSIISYIWILCLIPFLLKKQDEDIRFHAKQGLMLFIVEIGIAIIGIIPFLGSIIYLFGTLICGLVSLIAIVQVLMGNKWEIPVISEWAEKIKI